ncbi:MAG TPA: hypothetical protein VGI81_19350 [Tepidisphaeraceae bacterium]
MKSKVPRIPILSTLAFLLLITVLVLWVRSPRHADAVLFYTPAGHLTGMASDHGGMLFCASDIPFGREMGLTADAMSTSADEFAAIHVTLFDPSNEKWHFLGFHVAAGTLGTWGWKFNAILVPYWALLIPLAIPPLTGFRRAIRRARRRRRGQCLACGYDLRQSPERCPECGRPVEGSGSGAAVKAVSSETNGTLLALVSWLVVGATLAAVPCAVARGRAAGRRVATAPPEQAIFNRTIRQIDIQPTTLDRAVASLAQAAGARIELDSSFPNSPTSAAPVSASLHDLGFASALRAICEPSLSANSYPGSFQIWATGPTLHWGYDSNAAFVVRSYPVAELLREQLGFDQLDQDPLGSGGVVFLQPKPDAGKELVELVSSSVRSYDWTNGGGTLAALAVAAGRLWVCQTQEGHAAVGKLIAGMRSTGQNSDTRDADSIGLHTDLNQHIDELNLESATLEDAIEAVRKMTSANLVVYWNTLAAAAISRDVPIKLHLWNVTLGQALSAMLAVAGGESYTAYAVRDGVIVVTTADALNAAATDDVRVYDVRDLLSAFIASHLPAPGTQPADANPTIANSTNGGWDQPRPTTAADAGQALANIIEDTVDKDTWKDNGGSSGILHVFAGRLVITQTSRNQRKIAALLRASKEQPDGPAAEPANPHADLEQRIPELNLDSTTLEDAIDLVRKATKANLVVNWNALAASGISRDTQIKLRFRNATLDRVLATILNVAGGDYPTMHAVRDGIIAIATQDVLRDTNVRVYDVRDLVEPARGIRPSPGATQPEPQQSTVQLHGSGDPMSREEAIHSLTRLVEDDIDTDTWRDNGGSIGSVREFAGRLVITQSPATHRKIAALLRTLRAGGNKEGTELMGHGR